MSAEQAPQTHKHVFQTEVSQLLHLMVHSVYTEKEVFLRELISNASDACDKLRYEAIAQPGLLADDARLAIRISFDKSAGTLTVADNGIGMNEQELIDNLGTIARSGTRAFLERMTAGSEGSSLIGQFGVGFYSAFMVADRIDVVSHKAGEDRAWLWVSDGASGFTVTPAPEAPAKVSRGTSVTLALKQDARNFLEDGEIERIVRTYSDHILFPIEFTAADGKTRQVNSASALWQRSKSEVRPEEYKEVYNTVAHQFDEPALTLHYKAEGRQSYAVLLFVPTRPPFDLFEAERKGRVRLYVRRVFITEDASLLPAHLRFVRGVIDSEDVPLNISREVLQNNPQVAQIRRAVTGRLLAELETLAEKEAARFESIWDAFGPVLKEGIYEDFERRDQLLKLARFRSTAGPGWRSLKDYVAEMKPGQTEIYYLAGDNLELINSSPQLEAAKARGVEVLLMADPVDHFWTSMGLGYEGKTLKSLTQGAADLSSIPVQSTAEPEAKPDDVTAVVSALKEALGPAVSDVRASKLLVSSPVCLVAAGDGPDRGLERLLQRQKRGAAAKPVLEINPTHPLIKGIGAEIAAGRKEQVRDLGHLLLDQALVLDGELPADPAKFAERLNRYVVRGLGH
ncbi:MAG: molecular chaperone HtpG [Hyphomicrobiaceae bacterium]